MRIDIATLFPDMCQAVLQESIVGRARAEGKIDICTHNIRDYTLDKHRRVDDYPYGGGCGMLMQPQPIADCCAAIAAGQRAALGADTPTHVVFLTAAGAPYTQQTCKRLAALPCLTLVCGHYEGIDQRVIDALADEEISIGDYVITGGELAALVVADSIARLQPGVLAQPEGYEGESHYDGLLEYPQYTRPEVWQDRAVPPVLLSGHHANIVAWQRRQSEQRTRARRPDLWQRYLVQKKPDRTKKKKRKRGEEPAFSVRKAAAQDADAIARLQAALWPDLSAEGHCEETAALLAKEDACFFLCREGETPVGFAQCQLRHDYVEGTETSPVGYLEGIFVKEDCRHKGYAGALLAACEAWAKARGCREFASDCELDDPDSLGFHLALRFDEANRIICFTKKL